MKKLLIGLTAIVLAGMFALPGVAQAQEDGDATVEGRGSLHARGEGDVDITMGGRIKVRLDGDVTITDNAGDMRIRLRGDADPGDEERLSNVHLTNWRGVANVSGTDFTVSIDGKVALHARGRGEASLVGTGFYKTRNGDRTVWDGMVVIGEPG